MTCASLSPALSRSRTRTRRSCARGACESSIDSFWQTMQRSSFEMARARASSTGSASISLGSTAHVADEATSAISRASVCRYSKTTPSFRRLQRRLFGCLKTRRPRCPDTQAPIGQRQRAAAKHEERAEPDQKHVGLEEEPHRDAAVLVRIAKRKIELADAARHERGFGGRHLPGRESAAARLHDADNLAGTAHRELADDVAVVGAGAVEHAVKGDLITRDLQALRRLD